MHTVTSQTRGCLIPRVCTPIASPSPGPRPVATLVAHCPAHWVFAKVADRRRQHSRSGLKSGKHLPLIVRIYARSRGPYGIVAVLPCTQMQEKTSGQESREARPRSLSACRAQDTEEMNTYGSVSALRSRCRNPACSKYSIMRETETCGTHRCTLVRSVRLGKVPEKYSHSRNSGLQLPS